MFRILRREGFFRWLPVIAVVACTGVLLSRPVVMDAARLLPSSSDGHRLQALVVLQAADCGSALEFLRLYQRPPFRDRIALQGLVLGSSQELREAHITLRDSGLDLPLRPASGAARRTLAVFGYRATPFALLFDRDGRIVLAHGPAAGPEQLRQLEHSLAVVVEQ